MITCIDIGGGTTRIGFSKKRSFAEIVRFATKNVFEDEIKKIAEEIYKINKRPKGIVIATAGAVDKARGIIISWGQKKSWWGKKVFEPLSKYFPKTEFLIGNDASLAALGEAVFGAGKNYNIVGYITLSTGVGGCLIVNRQIVPHKFGIEPAHQIINSSETKKWSCEQKGCFESYASGTAFKQIFGVSPEKCRNQDIWNRYGKQLAVGFANIIALWSPEIIVLGGGVANKFNIFIDPLKKELSSLLPMYKIPKIVKSKLKEPGLSGGLAYYFSKYR